MGSSGSQEHVLNFLSLAGLRERLEATRLRPLTLQMGKRRRPGAEALDRGLTAKWESRDSPNVLLTSGAGRVGRASSL